MTETQLNDLVFDLADAVCKQENTRLPLSRGLAVPSGATVSTPEQEGLHIWVQTVAGDIAKVYLEYIGTGPSPSLEWMDYHYQPRTVEADQAFQERVRTAIGNLRQKTGNAI
jgi:hypothetical protein